MLIMPMANCAILKLLLSDLAYLFKVIASKYLCLLGLVSYIKYVLWYCVILPVCNSILAYLISYNIV